ncbi:MAG: hypothetical protein WBZ36_09770 [Candidatus Nitrosopolaris sp.]
MTERSYKFYCNVCFADRESDCICNKTVGYDAVTGYPCVDMTDEEHVYLYNGSVSQVSDELKLGTRIKTEDTGPTANSTIDNTTCNLTDHRSNEKDVIDNKKRFYCIDCSKFTEDEVVSYDSNDRPVVSHNNGHTHSVIFATDFQRLLELGTSLGGQSAIYVTAEMYGIPVEKLEQVIVNIGKGV